MEYHIRFYESGRYICEIGGPVRNLHDAVEQMHALGKEPGYKEREDFVGCSWLRAGITECGMLVVDDWGQLIRTIKEDEECS